MCSACGNYDYCATCGQVVPIVSVARVLLPEADWVWMTEGSFGWWDKYTSEGLEPGPRVHTAWSLTDQPDTCPGSRWDFDGRGVNHGQDV